MGNSDTLTQSFSSIRLPTQGMMYHARWTPVVNSGELMMVGYDITYVDGSEPSPQSCNPSISFPVLEKDSQSKLCIYLFGPPTCEAHYRLFIYYYNNTK
jgi:hypothetical protein